MGIRFILMVNKQGHTRLAQYCEYLTLEERRALEGEIVCKCLARNEQQVTLDQGRSYIESSAGQCPHWTLGMTQEAPVCLHWTRRRRRKGKKEGRKSVHVGPRRGKKEEEKVCLQETPWTKKRRRKSVPVGNRPIREEEE
ncbi:unnamed protein product [Fraxinus pennsylvanica]|uniref:AP complex mu/sigma subunit domain-containing protein n=1 Tax=Fraxinus pennsylvanica TaxID=56036 RepID=A0AAD2A6X4_9LAMI|nr:unnamed protein product [Fraxinus pennsylvanica]